MEEIILRDDFIKLGQAIKAAGLFESGVEAKIVIHTAWKKTFWRRSCRIQRLQYSY